VVSNIIENLAVQRSYTAAVLLNLTADDETNQSSIVYLLWELRLVKSSPGLEPLLFGCNCILTHMVICD